jgi:ParB-like chromosome segregation protein Spo0J
MSDDEYAALKADIGKHGQREDVVVLHNDGRILDGVHRAKACTELGIEPKTRKFVGTAEEARALVLSLNVHRRHLTIEQRREVIAGKLKSDPTQSNNAIAKTIGVSDKTVAAVRQQLEGRSEIPNVGQRTDSKGRKQPAYKLTSEAVEKARERNAKEQGAHEVAKAKKATTIDRESLRLSKLTTKAIINELRTRYFLVKKREDRNLIYCFLMDVEKECKESTGDRVLKAYAEGASP